MVQYVFTPWRDRRELLMVRHQFYPSPSSPSSPSSPARAATRESGEKPDEPDRTDEEGQSAQTQNIQDTHKRQQYRHRAVARVSMWMQRGNCPHMVESTALLTAATLSDESTATENAGSSTYAVRAAYSAAFSRFVTGLLDGHQDKQRKQSMYAIAKTIGLPATFVELRHQSTHEQLPSLAKLRSAAKKALLWIWDYYWKQLQDDAHSSQGPRDGCRETVLKYLRENEEPQRRKIMRQLRQFDLDRSLKAIAELQETLPGNQVYLKCLKLSRELMTIESGTSGTETPTKGKKGPATDDSETQALQTRDPAPAEGSELDTGWSDYQGAWKPKPIGIV